MNSLSLVLYLAGIAEGVRNTLTGFITIGFLVLVVAAFAILSLAGESYKSDAETAFYEGALYTLRKWWLLPIVMALSVLVPTKTTIIYMIAASEVGEKVLGGLTPELNKTREIVNNYLDSQLKESKK